MPDALTPAAKLRDYAAALRNVAGAADDAADALDRAASGAALEDALGHAMAMVKHAHHAAQSIHDVCREAYPAE